MGQYQIAVPILVMAVILCIAVGLLWLLQHDRVQVVAVITGLLLLATGIIAIASRAYLQEVSSSLSVGGYYEAGLLDRVQVLIDNTVTSLTGTMAEQLMNGYVATVGWKWLLLFVFGVICLYMVATVVQKAHGKTADGIAWRYIVIALLYLVCLIPFATRIQTQHFIPLTCIIAIIFALALNWILRQCEQINAKIGCVARAVVLTLGIMVGMLTAYNRQLVVHTICETEGTGYYTHQINVMAEEALDNLHAGEREIYVFPEWGFMTGFNYLTNNQVAFSTSADLDSLNQYLSEGYTICMLAWEMNGLESDYKDLLSQTNCGSVEEDTYYYTDGSPAFYKIMAR